MELGQISQKAREAAGNEYILAGTNDPMIGSYIQSAMDEESKEWKERALMEGRGRQQIEKERDYWKELAGKSDASHEFLRNQIQKFQEAFRHLGICRSLLKVKNDDDLYQAIRKLLDENKKLKKNGEETK